MFYGSMCACTYVHAMRYRRLCLHISKQISFRCGLQNLWSSLVYIIIKGKKRMETLVCMDKDLQLNIFMSQKCTLETERPTPAATRNDCLCSWKTNSLYPYKYE